MKYAVAEITRILGSEMSKNLQIITAENAEEAVAIYKSTRPHIDRYGFKVKVEEYQR